MSTVLLECIEPHSRPARRTLTVRDGEEVALYVLAFDPKAPAGLRRTALREIDQNPPPGAQLLCWLRIDGDGLVISDVGRGLTLELLRSDLRSQVTSGVRLASNTLLECTLHDQSRIGFSLSLTRSMARGASVGVSGSGTRTSRVRFATDNVWWLITDTKGILVSVTQEIWDRGRDMLLRMGIDGRVLSFVGGLLIAAAVGGYAAYNRHMAANAAEERAEQAQSALVLAEAAQAASLATELACLEQRADLVEKMGDLEAQAELSARQALAFPQAGIVSRELGGQRMGEAAVRELDLAYVPGIVASVVARMRDAPKGDPDPCLAQDASLGPDLPRYLLLWHPDPALTCPSDFEAADGGVRLIGRWGLSDRLALSFASGGDLGTGTDPEVLSELLGDSRREDRWSAFTLALAYRRILETLLRYDRTDRAPVLPSQAHLWALALLDAYNRMPSPADGVLDAAAEDCVNQLVLNTLNTAPPATPGEAILPDIARVATSDVQIAAAPTPGCPWPRNALQDGADAALRAAARLGTAQPATSAQAP